MGKYFKRFENHSQYEQYIQSENYIKPNISVCDSEREVHYNSLFIHEYVDLGLPSGTLWATENIKDSNGNDLYFAWGDTQGYMASQVGTDKNFSYADYKFGTSNSNLTKYNSTDGKTILESEDDAATVLWGENWCIPTKEQFQELIANTTTTWTTTDGKTGITFTSTNGNSVFFLAFGIAMDGEIYTIDNWGYYWSRSSYADYGAWCIYFRNDKKIVNTGSVTRYGGYTVRPVKNLLNQ